MNPFTASLHSLMAAVVAGEAAAKGGGADMEELFKKIRTDLVRSQNQVRYNSFEF